MPGTMEADLTALNRRVEKMEQRVWGSGPRTSQKSVAHGLAEFGTDVGNSLALHDRILPIMKRIDELEMYLDPMFAESCSQTDRVKQSIVLSQAGQIEQEYNDLEQIKGLSGELDGKPLSEIGEVTSKMDGLKRIQVEERRHGDDLNKQTLELVEKYNSIISSLTQAFIQADATISAAEEKAKKPVYY